jgi:membrane protein implicated in regulation of membrane protease activity
VLDDLPMAAIVAIALAIFVLPEPWGIVAIVVGIAIEVAENVFWFRYQKRRKVRTGVEGHVGERAVVVRALTPDGKGKVKFRGEVWNARAVEPVAEGEAVTVTGTDRLTLEVEPRAAGADAPPPQASSRPSQ